MSKHTPMVVKAARVLSDRAAAECNVNAEDNWNTYGSDIYLADAQAALDACGAAELLAALREIADDYAERFDLDSPSTNPGMKYVVRQARAAIAKAEGEAS